MKPWAALGPLLGLALFGVARTAAAADVETLRETGAADKRFNIAVLGDGYRTTDQAKLKTDAQAIVDYLFGVAPLRQYAQLFNVKLVHVISNENGADNGSYGDVRDTALGANFNCDGIDRLLCVDAGTAAMVAAQEVPEYNFAIVLVNDPKYGGSGGTICASSSNEQSFEVLAHEVGHSLAHLADEYSYEGNQPACNQQTDCREANTTIRTPLDQIKWKNWIEAGTPVPTPATSRYDGVVGLFEGARYTPKGVYRPELNCKMRDLGAEYCAVCAEQFVKAIWTSDNVQMVETAEPEGPNVVVADCEPFKLSITSPPLTPSTYRYSWLIDGEPQTEPSNAIQLAPGALKQGEHQVLVVVEDATELVRTDPSGVLKDGYAWSVNVTAPDCPTPVVGGAGGVGGADAMGGATAAGSGGVAGALAAAGGGTAGSSSTGGVAGSDALGNDAGVRSRPAPPPRTAGCGCVVPARSVGLRELPLVALALGVGLRRARRRRACKLPVS